MTVILLSLSNAQLGLTRNVTSNNANFDYAQLEVQSDEPEALRQLPGNPDDQAYNALPYVEYNPFDHLDTDFERSELGSYYLPINVLAIAFYPTTTIGEVNALLRELDAEIVAASPGRISVDVGLFLGLRVQTTRFDELQELVRHLRDHHSVKIVIEYTFDCPLNAVPQPTQEVRWNTEPYGNLWGLEVSRVSQLWNCNAAV
jgi:hypothetical protein